MIRKYKSTLLGKLNIEVYDSADTMVRDLETRPITDSNFTKNPYRDSNFTGATREQAYTMMREGYQPVVDALRDETKKGFGMTQKRIKFQNDVVGFAPIVPNAIMGLPNSMVNTTIKVIKNKVIDIYYDMTAGSCESSQSIINAGIKMLGVILDLQAKGYRFNLYCTQSYWDKQKGADMLCVKVKSASQPLDLKRMSFQIAHSAFFRGIGFDWYSKVPGGVHRICYGSSPSYHFSREQLDKEYKTIFGKTAVYFSYNYMKGANKDDAKNSITNDK